MSAFLPTGRTVRLWSGLVLFVYLIGHFGTHITGLWSFDTMRDAIGFTSAIWRSWPGTIVLYGALSLHGLFALWPLVQRRSLRMSAGEWWQVVLGVSIPFLMLIHVMGTRYASAVYGLKDTYDHVFLAGFVFTPLVAFAMAFGIVVAWAHGVLGLYFWARIKPWYGAGLHQVLLAVAVLFPALALASFIVNGNSVAASATEASIGRYRFNLGVGPDYAQSMGFDMRVGYAIAAAVLLSIIGARLLRRIFDWRRDVVRVKYLDGPTVTQPTGASLLEISRAHGLPHASVCGGRGRCSTCRVRVLRADPSLAQPDATERRVLARLPGAGSDVRLACQLRPSGTLHVARLLPPDAGVDETLASESSEVGQERVVTVLFADLRDFTATAEARLPFDVVYLINQFSNTMGETIEAHGGYFDKFLGDGLMAIFGVRDAPEAGARAALAACRDMGIALDRLNARLADDLQRPLRMGLGVNSGPAVLGDMGYGVSRRLTAIGDTVNIASRLEAVTKDEGCTLCVADSTVRLAGATLGDHLKRTVALRGREGTTVIHAVDDLAALDVRTNALSGA